MKLLLAVLSLLLVPANSQYLVGVDGTRDGNSPGRPCVFPFTYNSLQYYECTTIHNNFVPWCATTSNYDAFKQWGNCEITLKANRTRNGNAGGSYCVFPFVYKGVTYYNCTSKDYYSSKPWCSTSADYSRDRQWGECYRCADIKGTGGNSDGSSCTFPFRYQNGDRFGCVNTNNKGIGWCGTTRNYDVDKRWTNCLVTTLSETNNCPSGYTYTKVEGRLSQGGIGQNQQFDTTQNAECANLCSAQANCVGFDFDRAPGKDVRCFLHLDSTKFQNKDDSAINVDQYTKVPCDSSSSGTQTAVIGGTVTTKGGNSGNTGRCSFPFWYKGQQYTSCTCENWYTPWCATTPDYGRDGLWAECGNIPTA